VTATFTLPFSVLNNVQFIDGIEDVTIEVLEPQDVIDAVVDNTLGSVDIAQAIENQVRGGLLPSGDDLVEEVDRAIDSIVDDIEGSVTDLQTELEAFIDESLGIVEEDIDNLRGAVAADVEEIVGAVSSEFDSLSRLVEDRVLPTVEGVESSLTDELGDVRSNVETAINESAEDLDEAVEGVSGALASLGDTLGDVRDDVQTLVDTVPTDFEAAVQRGVEAAEPTVDGAGLFTEPVGFVSGVITSGVERAVSDETAQALSDVVE
jgi:uncharacterized phage infection (PIP) family protein YhgE